MENGPAIFAGTVLVVFGGALLMWTGSRALRRAPVALSVNPVASALVGFVVSVAALVAGVWCFLRL